MDTTQKNPRPAQNGSSRLRVKFGEHEFEAEGPIEGVHSQFALFRQMVAPQSSAPVPPGPAAATAPALDPNAPPPFHKMVRISGKIVFLTVPAKVEDAVLLLLLAQKQFRENERVLGGELMKGLKLSGIKVPRVDAILNKHISARNVASTGFSRSRRYRLTPAGADRALQIARMLSPLVR